jgi:hypothetical protein
MILDSKKTDYSRLVSALKELSAASAKCRKDPRDWALETVKTLKAGRLEASDLVEFVVAAFESDLAACEDVRPKWDYAQAVLGLIAAMEAAGLSSPRSARVREALKGWKPGS